MTRPGKHLTAILCLAAVLNLSGCLIKPQDNPVDSLMGRRAETRQRLTQAAEDAVAAGNTTEALVLYEHLYKIHSHNPDVAIVYAQLLRRSGNAEKAARVLEPLVTSGGFIRKDANPALVNELAAAYIGIGDFTDANTLLHSVLDNDADAAFHPDANSLLAIVSDAKGDHKTAEGLYWKALKDWDGDPTPVMNNLGLCLAAQGRTEDALKVLRRALVMSSNDKAEIARNIALISTKHNKAVAQKHTPKAVTKKAKPVHGKSPACGPCPTPEKAAKETTEKK